MKTLPSIDISETDKLSEVSAIYFVYQADTLLYVGKAKNLKTRWADGNHHREKQFLLLGDCVITWLEVPCFEDLKGMAMLERWFINALKPELNYTAIPGRVNGIKPKKLDFNSWEVSPEDVELMDLF